MSRPVLKDPAVRSRLASERGAHLAGEMNIPIRHIREYRYRARSRGVSFLPCYFWRSPEEKALIRFIRANRQWSPDYWQRAAAHAGGRSVGAARARWRALRKQDPTLPIAPADPKQGFGWRTRRKWSDAQIAEILEMAEIYSVARIAEMMDETGGAIRGVLRRHRKPSAKTPCPSSVEFSKRYEGFTEADVRAAAQAWDEFEKQAEGTA